MSLPFDRRLWRDDIAGSRGPRAHAGRGRAADDGRSATRCSPRSTPSRPELDAGTFAFVPSDEDIHTAVERRVTELAGAAGAKLHTGRSRNDQVGHRRSGCGASASCAASPRRVLALQHVLLRAGRGRRATSYLPGYTHLQRAQPVLLAHHLLAHGWALARDVDRLLATIDRLDVSPLGAGALAGSSLPLDPARTGRAARLRRACSRTRSTPSSDRDFVAEALFDLALDRHPPVPHRRGVGAVDDARSSASPGSTTATPPARRCCRRRRTPTSPSWPAARPAGVIGNLTGLLATLKGLPLAYNRDLQEDKEPLFDAVEQVSLALAAIGGMIATATFVPERMQAAADSPTASATDLAEWLVAAGHAVPPGPRRRRRAWCARRSSRARRRWPTSCAEHPELGPDAAALVAPGVSVRRRTTYGGAGPGPVAAQLDRFRSRVAADAARLDPQDHQEPARG